MREQKQRGYPGIARIYAGDAVSGKIPACGWTVNACRRQLADLEEEKSAGTSPTVYLALYRGRYV
jgi:hypothetical protein